MAVCAGIARNVDVAAQPFDGMIGNHEPVSVAVHIQPSDNVLAAQASEHKMPGLYLDHVAALLQAIEGGIEVGAGSPASAEFTDELLEGGAGVWKAGDVVEDGGVGHAPIIRGRCSGSTGRRRNDGEVCRRRDGLIATPVGHAKLQSVRARRESCERQ